MAWSTTSRRLSYLSLVVLTCTLVVGSGLPQAEAGGSWMYPLQDRYEPGDTVTLVGYPGGGSQGSMHDGPFFGYLFRAPSSDSWVAPRAIPLPVGEIEFTTVSYMKRASISFELPDHVKPGMYWLDYCNQSCEERYGDLIGAVFWVGQEPDWPVIRGWPSNEPEIANLDDDALLSAFGEPMTAGEFREFSNAD